MAVPHREDTAYGSRLFGRDDRGSNSFTGYFAGHGSSNPSNAAEYWGPAFAGTIGSCLIPRERNPL
jgi:hypothetical protein